MKRKIALFLTAALIVLCAGVNYAAASSELEAVGTKERFLEIMENVDGEQYYNGYMFKSDAVFETAAPSMAPGAARGEANYGASGDYSQTNVQVSGVDEADLIKTDGKYIYYVQNDILYIVETEPDGKLTLVFSQLYDNFFPNELYLDGEHLVVIGHRVVFSRPVSPEYYYSYGYYNSREYAAAYVYDIGDKKNITKTREVSIDGTCLSSRKIGDTLYLVVQRYHYYGDVLPCYRDDAVSADENTVPFDTMYIIPDGDVRQIMFIVTLDLSEPDKEIDIQSFLGSSEIMYMSVENMYLAQQVYDVSKGWTYSTKLYKFALEKDTVQFVMTGKVDGRIINQFSMDERDGFLRIASTTNTANNLYILDGNLETVGAIEDIAPGERIYSVRFLGDRGYVVTFKQTDPLFAFDLSDPANPKLLGALKIPGYSTYLHPYDENHLIGFGQDTEEIKNGAVIAAGLKMSMFDITDMTNPIELFSEYLGDRGSTSPLLYNHKAILQSTEKDIFAFPAYEYKIPEGYDNYGYGTLNRQGAFVYSIDMEDAGFVLRGVITHKTQEDILKSGYYGGNEKSDVVRIIYIGDVFYTISAARVQSNKIDTLEAIDAIDVIKR